MRKIFVLLGAIVIMALAVPAVFATQPDDVGPGEQITICHHTGSENNPTVELTVNSNALAGHQASHGVNEFDTLGPCPDGGDDGGGDDGDDDDNGHEGVEICHLTGNGSYNLIEVDENAVDAHLEHGDVYPNGRGRCPDGDDGGDTPGVPREPQGSSENLNAPCVDIFHPFLAASPFNPAAKAFLVESNEDLVWNYADTDLSEAWWTTGLNIVPADYDPEDRDLVRLGNDAGMLCINRIPSGPQIVAFVVNDGTPEETVAGIVQVQQIGGSMTIISAAILEPTILVRDPLWGGDWGD